jgi:HD-like signal output (HDOD) protein
MDMNRYWRASLYNAVVARNMARCCEIDELEIEELFISGLLLNVGKLPLYYSEPDLLLLVEERASVSGLPDYQIERELLGFDHAEVGALLAKSWNFSAQLNRLISGHHAVFSSDISKQEAIISLSAQLADSLNYDNNGSVCHEQPAENEAELLEKLKLSVDEYELIVTNSFEDYLLAYEAFCGSNI